MLSSGPCLNFIPIHLSRLDFKKKTTKSDHGNVLSIGFQCFCLQTGCLFTQFSVFYSCLRELKCSFFASLLYVPTTHSVSCSHTSLLPFFCLHCIFSLFLSFEGLSFSLKLWVSLIYLKNIYSNYFL